MVAKLMIPVLRLVASRRFGKLANSPRFQPIRFASFPDAPPAARDGKEDGGKEECLA